MAEHKRKKRVTPYEKAVNYLSQIEYIEEMIGEKQDIIDSLRSSITGTSASTESERVQTSPKDRLGETCAKIVDLCEQLNKDIDSFVDMKAEVIQTIDQYVDDLKERRLLYLRYLKFIPIESCAKELRISRATAYNFHKAAMQKIARKFENR
ncbi:DUF1492 domain-containing protein [bacterium 1XD21-13]|nr:DUF1492 domain-containing protein [bacterium 1XD21-13]